MSWVLCLLLCVVPAQGAAAEQSDLFQSAYAFRRSLDDGADIFQSPQATTGFGAQLPDLDGSAFPPYNLVFIRGECDAPDFGVWPHIRINPNKTCFSCFRIPTMIKTNAPGVGTILAFAEGRRGGGVGFKTCPDAPDTHLVYKRSVDGGRSWGSLKVLQVGLQLPNRAENGHCSSQAAPVVDPLTNIIHVAFNSDGPCTGSSGSAMIVHSKDDGVTWSVPEPLLINGVKTSPGASCIIGPTKGLAGRFGPLLPGGFRQTRLMLPGEGGRFLAASIYSDDHGKTWNSNGTTTVGEMDWTVCTPGACGGRGKYAMMNRGGVTTGIHFSNDTQHWSAEYGTVHNVTTGSHHGKPGLVAVPGGLISSQQILQCPTRVPCSRKPSDVIALGMGLLASKDGITWKLLRKLWPFGGMYTTLIPLTTDKDGGALTYGVIFLGGTIGGSSVEEIVFQNFTFNPSDLDMEGATVIV